MASVARLYTPDILALATSLARMPFDPAMPLHGQARSATCGSTLELSLRLDDDGRIAAIGLRAQACAIGQAGAAIFADGVTGRSPADITDSRDALAQWLAGEVPRPDWPGLAALEAARAFPGRHGAILLGWNAAIDALSQDSNPG